MKETHETDLYECNEMHKIGVFMKRDMYLLRVQQTPVFIEKTCVVTSHEHRHAIYETKILGHFCRI